MKTAILISGHMRSFDRCLPTLHWHVFRHFPGADYYVSTEPDADAPQAELLRSKYPGAQVSIDSTPQPPVVSSLVRWNIEHAHEHAPYAISVAADAVLGQLWRLQQCWDTLPKDHDYDVYIRCRPDLWFESADLPFITYRHPKWPLDALTPWWGRFGGVNDRFAILGYCAATDYFTTWSKIHDLLAEGCPLHPESLLKASLLAATCRIDDTLDVSFSTLRANGERRFPEIMAQDIAHRVKAP